MNDTRDSIVNGAEAAWANVLIFLPKFAMFLIILIAGFFIAKALAKLLDRILERVGFDNLVERGGVKKALERTRYDASDLLSKLVFYTIFLFVMQLAFGVFGPNPVSTMLDRVIAFLPNIFVAIVIVIIAAAVARGVKDIVQAALGGLGYGKFLARAAAATILVVGVFAALNQLQIAPAIVNGIFYAGLAIIAGSAIIAIGGGGIVPMRAQWDKALNRLAEEAPKIKAQAAQVPDKVEEKAEVWRKVVDAPPRHPYANKP